MHVDRVTGEIVDSAMRVHSVLGTGLLEAVYEACLAHELRKRGLHVHRQFPLPVTYDGIEIKLGYRVDMIVEGVVVVEIKAVAKLHHIHSAQLLSYLKLSGCSVGLLL